MPGPFRFGVQIGKLPAHGWRERVQRIEALGYSSLFFPDHFGDQWEPVTALAAVAAASTTLQVGSLVYDVDYRHPVVLAKASATLQLLSDGRHEFGLGAGWMETDYREAGMTYDSPGTRIARLEEALQIIRSMWTQEKTSFEGEHYTIRDVARALPLGEVPPPRILVGGGGRKLLGVAGRHADIVGINPKLEEGKVTPATVADVKAERVREKVRWVREAAEAAGRDPGEIELNAMIFVTAITDDPAPVRQMVAKQTTLTEQEVAECPLFLTGSAQELQDRLHKQREETGIRYIVLQSGQLELLEQFSEAVLRPLTRA